LCGPRDDPLAAPQVQPADDQQLARDPAPPALACRAWRGRRPREALKAGAPVLVQVPRRGYVPAVSCQDCRERARWPALLGPLTLQGKESVATCRWCARPAAGLRLPVLRGPATARGSDWRAAHRRGARTALPDVPVWTSGGEHILERVAGEPGLVLATPGAEPAADGRLWRSAVARRLAMLTRADLRAAEETARAWFHAAALARPASRGGG
jgi:primosomal protein N' (replication factor Y)